MFKKLFTMILLAGAFFGGYHMGHQPGSPDLSPFAQDCYAKAAAAYHQAEALVRAGSEQIKAAQPTAQSAARPPERSAAVSAKLPPGVRSDGRIYDQEPTSHRRS